MTAQGSATGSARASARPTPSSSSGGLFGAWRRAAENAFPALAEAVPPAADLLLVPGLAYLTVRLSHWLGAKAGWSSMWPAYFALGAATPVLAWLLLAGLHRRPAPSRAAVAASGAVALAGLYALARMIKKSFLFFGPGWGPQTTLFVLTVGFALAGAALVLRRRTAGSRVAQAGVWLGAAAASLAAWCALFQLPNWVHLSAGVSSNRMLVSPLLGACWLAAVLFLWPRSDAHANPQNPWTTRTLGLAALAVFALMSFRYDTFFLGSSEMHWEYYVGAIRGIRDGGALLWDLPSQYGFLNIALAAALPLKSAWQALYVLQGLLLIAAAVALVVTLAGDGPGWRAFLAFLVALASLFFADPDLIGPYLYPSSSVMRFFWCYALLAFLVYARPGERMSLESFAWRGSLIWTLGSLWSFESFAYCSSTFFPALAAAALPTRRGSWFRCFAIPFATLAAAVGLVTAAYLWRSGHAPDWPCFFEHALSYAGGFGSVEMSPWGSACILGLLFCALTTVVARLGILDLRTRWLVPAVGALGCLWGVSSYFVGRSVPNNVTAILPVLCLLIGIGIRAAESLTTANSGTLLRLISIPLVTIVLATSFANADFVSKIRGFKTFNRDVTEKLRPAEPELEELLGAAGMTPEDPVVYYGSAAAMPRWRFEGRDVVGERAWLPTPLQLLEAPIAPERRAIYVRRYMRRASQPGFLVQAKGPNERQTDERIPDWLALIAESHEPVRTLENDRWKFVRFEPKAARP